MSELLAPELLGVDPRARFLLINADDLGMHPAIDRGIFAALDHGIARSTSLMTTCPASDAALDTLCSRPDIAFGIHLTLVRDHHDDTWAPRAPASDIPSLLDPDGLLPLHADADELLARALPREIETEFRAQVHVVLEHGLHPTHLDFH
ncbi:ChbG/HpnK family deacetylase [Pseudonocardia sp. HH130630-07]|uniref:ChbG/HpnK family deacetylase n=1 Tax=Pseudonocardia sp. HH130630-07 TaxID=1690815 RepID=UPI0008152644|nr:ChbG/HpnK family deacetylase [Pseudonocardia sp. HH130630-07]ANY10660.1 hypothetical protein AFB00_30095 [Pseudonocardia sp. HH130630-07]